MSRGKNCRCDWLLDLQGGEDHRARAKVHVDILGRDANGVLTAIEVKTTVLTWVSVPLKQWLKYRSLATSGGVGVGNNAMLAGVEGANGPIRVVWMVLRLL